MNLMGDGLKRVAGSKMELVLYRLSGTFRAEEGYVCFPLSTLSRMEEAHA